MLCNYRLQIAEEFAALFPDAPSLAACWSQYRDKVLERAHTVSCKNTDLQQLLSEDVDDLDEGLLCHYM